MHRFDKAQYTAAFAAETSVGTAAALATVTGGGGEVGFGPTVASGSSATSPSVKVLCESLGHASQYRKNKEGYTVGLGLKKRAPTCHS